MKAKKIGCLLLILTILFLIGCGSNKSGNESSEEKIAVISVSEIMRAAQTACADDEYADVFCKDTLFNISIVDQAIEIEVTQSGNDEKALEVWKKIINAESDKMKTVSAENGTYVGRVLESGLVDWDINLDETGKAGDQEGFIEYVQYMDFVKGLNSMVADDEYCEYFDEDMTFYISMNKGFITLDVSVDNDDLKSKILDLWYIKAGLVKGYSYIDKEYLNMGKRVIKADYESETGMIDLKYD